MSAILFRHNVTWILEARFSDSYHAWHREFATAKAAREHAKRYKLRVIRATNCDCPDEKGGNQ